ILLLAMADDQIGQMRLEERPTPVWLEVYTLVSAVVLVCTDGIEWIAGVLIGCLVMWICWKRSRAFNRFRLLSDGRARMERCLAKMGISDDTRVSEPVIKASGDMVWAIHLGDNDRADQIKTDDIAHMLKTDPARVIVTP